MATMGRHRWISHISSFRCILHRHFFASVSATEAPISTPADSLSSLANFLVGSLGFSEEQALSTSTKFTEFRKSQRAAKVSAFNFLGNADLVISFLEQKGLDKPQIRDVVFSVPQILTSRIEQNLEPKITFFQDVGLSVSDFADVISTLPGILGHGLDTTIRPAVEALTAIMGSKDSAIRVIKGFKLNTLPLVTKHLVCNVSSLQAKGIPIESIRRRILKQSSPFFRRPDVLKDMIAQAEEKWGIPPSSSQFLHAVHILGCLNEKNINSKCRVYESYGWEKSDVVGMFRRNPYCLAPSEGMIKAKLSFFMNELGFDPGYMVTKPHLMLCSFQKRVLPRHLVLQLLKEKGLVRENLPLNSALKMTESRFLERFIQPFEKDVPNLHKTYIDSIGSLVKEQNKGGKNIHFSRIKLKPDSARE